MAVRNNWHAVCLLIDRTIFQSNKPQKIEDYESRRILQND